MILFYLLGLSTGLIMGYVIAVVSILREDLKIDIIKSSGTRITTFRKLDNLQPNPKLDQ